MDRALIQIPCLKTIVCRALEYVEGFHSFPSALFELGKDIRAHDEDDVDLSSRIRDVRAR